MKYLVDTDWLIDVLGDLPSAIRALETYSAEDAGVSIITVGELYEGAVFVPDSERRLERCRTLLASFSVLPLTEPVMLRFATLRAQLRQQGKLIPDLDLLIASTAVEHDLVLMTRNHRHFARIPELQLYTE